MRNYPPIYLPSPAIATSLGGRGRSNQETKTILALSPNHVSTYQSKREPRYSIKILSNYEDPYLSIVDKGRQEENLSNPTSINIKSSLLSSLSNLNLNNALFVIDRALSECSNFHHFYGYSDFHLNLCRLSQDGDLKIKILRDSPHKETDQTITVEKILREIHSLCAPKVLDDFISYFNRNKLKTKCNYKCTRSLIKAYCACSKIEPQIKLDLSENHNVSLLQPSSYKSVERTPSIQSSEGKIRKGRRMTFGNYDKENEGQGMLSSRIKYKFGSLKDKILENTKKEIEPNNLFNAKLSKSSLMLPEDNLKVPSINSSIGKGSQTSTNPKTSGNHSITKENCLDLDSLQEAPNSTDNEYARLSHFQFSIINKPLLETSLSEVESHYESCSDHNFSPDRKSHQGNNIIQHEWVKKIDIFAASKEINESFSEGKEEMVQIVGSNPENLGKMARVICESCLLTSPCEKKVKEDS